MAIALIFRWQSGVGNPAMMNLTPQVKLRAAARGFPLFCAG